MDHINELPRLIRGIGYIFAPLRAGKILKQMQYEDLKKRAVYFVVYAAAGRTDDARIIALKIIKWDRFSNAPAVLRQTAESTLGGKSAEFLQALNIPEITNAAPPPKQDEN